MDFNPEELRTRHNPVGSPLWQMQRRMLDILQAIDGVCRAHDIPYWLSGGSMLGAVRHQGFIPWDDDLDIEMLRPDFERLIRLLPNELPDQFALQWHTTDPNYIFQFAKVRDRHSRLFERNGYDRLLREHGVWVDIFPLERAPRWMHRLSCASFGHAYKIMRTAADLETAMPRARRWATFHRRIVFPALRALAAIVPARHYDFALGIPYYQRSLPDDFTPVRRVPYEDTTAPIMKEAEKCLAYRYGDYMRLPDNPGCDRHADEFEIW